MSWLFYLPITLFILQLILLTVLSKRCIKNISQLVYSLTNNYTFTVHFMAFLFLPGTLIHELAHALTAGVMLIEVRDLELTPEIREDGVKLGSVQIVSPDPIRRAVIGVAPFIVGVGVIIGCLWYFSLIYLSAHNFSWLVTVLLLILIFQIGNTMFSSKKDLEGIIGVAVFGIGLIVAVYFINTQFFIQGVQSILTTLNPYIVLSVKFLTVPIALDLFIIGCAKLLLSAKRKL